MSRLPCSATRGSATAASALKRPLWISLPHSPAVASERAQTDATPFCVKPSLLALFLQVTAFLRSGSSVPHPPALPLPVLSSCHSPPNFPAPHQQPSHTQPGTAGGLAAPLPGTQREPLPCSRAISLSEHAPSPCARQVRLTGLSLSRSLFPLSETQAAHLLFPSRVRLPDFPTLPRVPSAAPAQQGRPCPTALQVGDGADLVQHLPLPGWGPVPPAGQP